MSKLASMKVWSKIVLIAVLGFAAAKTARAATLNSPFLNGVTGQSLGCQVVNVGTKPITTVTVRFPDSGDSTTCTNLGAGAPCFAYATLTPPNGFCAATFSGSKSNVRGAIYLQDGDGRTTVAVPGTGTIPSCLRRSPISSSTYPSPFFSYLFTTCPKNTSVSPG